MIETREAIANAQAIARECDFFSIGTNDLTQQLLNIDREHAIAAPVTDPRVLASIDTAMRAARAAGIPVDVCGEAASDHDTMPLMVGLGADELSVAAARVGEVRELVRGLDFGECARTVGALLG
jgi:phosphocarrier protein FPr